MDTLAVVGQEAVKQIVKHVDKVADPAGYRPVMVGASSLERSRFYQAGVFCARENNSPRDMNFESEEGAADFMCGYNAEVARLRAEADRRETKDKTFGLAKYFAFGAGFYAARRLWMWKLSQSEKG